jgi:hypothetical protein
VDLAKSFDFTSFAIIEMEYQAVIKDYVYHLKGLDRIRGVDYPKINEVILSTVAHLEKEKLPDTEDGPHLCIDGSGLGAPVKDFLKHAHVFTTSKQIFPVIFTGGESARYDSVTQNYNISKPLIIGNFRALMQHHRFDYAPDIKALPLLEEEIARFQRHQTASGRDGYDAETGAHDDLICAVAIPLIIGEWRFRKAPTGPLVFSGANKKPINSSTGSGPNWFAEAARGHNHGGAGATFIGGINHRSR